MLFASITPVWAETYFDETSVEKQTNKQTKELNRRRDANHFSSRISSNSSKRELMTGKPDCCHSSRLIGHSHCSIQSQSCCWGTQTTSQTTPATSSCPGVVGVVSPK